MPVENSAPVLVVPVDEVAGTSYTLTEDDSSRVKRFSDPAAVTVTVPSGLDIGTVVSVISAGAGGVTLSLDAGVTAPPGQFLTVGQYGEMSVLVVAVDRISVRGGET